MNLKKIGALILALSVTMTAFAGCTQKDEEKNSNSSSQISAEISGSEESSKPDESSSNDETSDNSESSSQTAEKETVKIAVMKGPTGMGMVNLMSKAEEGTSEGKYEIVMESTADAIVGKLADGSFDAAAIPANLASVIFNKTEGKISAAAINTLGVLYVVESGDTIHSLEDLKGKTIYSTGKGTTPEFAFRHVLKLAGIDADKDLTIEYKSEASEVAALMAQDKSAIALLPQPFVTVAQTKNADLRIALNLSEEWEKLDKNSSLVTGVMVVRKDFYENHREAYDLFMKEYEESVKFINENIDEGAKLVAKYEIAPEPVAKKAIPLCNIVFIKGEEMQNKLNGYLNTLFEQEPKSVGGKLPDETFFIK